MRIKSRYYHRVTVEPYRNVTTVFSDVTEQGREDLWGREIITMKTDFLSPVRREGKSLWKKRRH
jgi:hypothetical protein